MSMLVRILLTFIICSFFQPMSLAYQRPDKNIGFDLVMMKNGDNHHGTVVHEVFHLKTDYGLVSIPNLLMTEKQFKVTNRYNQELTLPLEQLLTLAYHVNYQNGMSGYNYCNHLSPGGLLQDYMVDGTPAPKLIALRGGTTTRYWWGNDVGNAKANCEGCGSLWDGEKTTVVGKFYPNHFGLHDTAGNVFEWVADCLHSSFSEAPIDASPIDKPNCGKRVIRGGAWSFQAKEIRSTNRWRDFPSRKSDDTGFRVVREQK